MINISLFFHRLFAWYWINTVKRNSVLVTHGKIKKNHAQPECIAGEVAILTFFCITEKESLPYV